MKGKHLALIPVQDIVELCEFDGTFDEGEGTSMDQPIKWKYPNKATPITTVGKLQDYEDKVGGWVAAAMKKQGVTEVYVEGLRGMTGWWSGEDIEEKR